MSEIAKRLNQCRKPTGDLGKIIVEDMNKSHFNLTSWGLEKINIENDFLVLDIGCGGGKTVNRIAERADKGKVYGMDYSDDCVKWSIDLNINLIKENKVEIFQGTVENIPFEAEKFDLITAVETIYFWPDVKANFSEVRRVLKTGGTFAIINEMYDSEAFRDRNNEFAAIGNMNILSSEELKIVLSEVGFNDIEIDLVEEKNWLRCVCSK
ncbi:class I SAM-dependent methyltransferase [Clostridium manihotivorum]|uniref:SAM-dependent methyltransferase n=1 Tax=Clostridium manihotivorum TaxID=2320868 RepID=A0A3R5UA63_9CLOT|nr:class I SAM-dependent methyltransferase [Clostridium manihotivorum]QAA33355.1 SAM-dependent methyltransferase [Clostridium manihotivorum]